MCGREPCRHENADAIKSFVAQTKALVAMTAERDAALAKLALLASPAIKVKSQPKIAQTYTRHA